MAILLDSGFIYAIYNKRDVNHETATLILKEIEDNKLGTAYITDYLFDETLTLTFTKSDIHNAIRIGRTLISSYDVIEVSISLFQEAWGLFQKRKLSFTDCTSLVVMHHFDIEFLATFDKGFKGLVKTVGV